MTPYPLMPPACCLCRAWPPLGRPVRRRSDGSWQKEHFPEQRWGGRGGSSRQTQTPTSRSAGMVRTMPADWDRKTAHVHSAHACDTLRIRRRPSCDAALTGCRRCLVARSTRDDEHSARSRSPRRCCTNRAAHGRNRRNTSDPLGEAMAHSQAGLEGTSASSLARAQLEQRHLFGVIAQGRHDR